MYNRKCFNGTCLYDSRSRSNSIFHYTLSDGTLIGIFQGGRGERPDLDFIVKYLSPRPKARLRTPSHTHWVVDLIIKHQLHSEATTKFVRFFRNLYDEIE